MRHLQKKKKSSYLHQKRIRPNNIQYHNINRVTPNEKFIEVNANTLDSLLQENGISVNEVNWIKIDVEGAELEVLKGAHNILSKSKDISLLIEIHSSESLSKYN